MHFSRVFLCHPYLHEYGSFLAENFQEFIWVFLKNENLDLHEIWHVYFLQYFYSKIWREKNQLIWISTLNQKRKWTLILHELYHKLTQ